MELENPEETVQIDRSAVDGGGEPNSDAPQNKDWEAILQEERAKTQEWKIAALKSKRQLRERRTEIVEEDPIEPETEDDRITRIATEVATKAVSIRTEDSILASKVKDPKQRELVKFYLQTRIIRTGTSEESLESDIDFAISAANSKKNAIKASELERAIINDSRVPASSGSPADRGVVRKPHGWTPEEEKRLEQKAKDLRIDPEKFKTDSWNNTKRTRVA